MRKSFNAGNAALSCPIDLPLRYAEFVPRLKTRVPALLRIPKIAVGKFAGLVYIAIAATCANGITITPYPDQNHGETGVKAQLRRIVKRWASTSMKHSLTIRNEVTCCSERLG